MTHTEKGFKRMINQLKVVANLPDVTGETIEQRTLAN